MNAYLGGVGVKKTQKYAYVIFESPLYWNVIAFEQFTISILERCLYLVMDCCIGDGKVPLEVDLAIPVLLLQLDSVGGLEAVEADETLTLLLLLLFLLLFAAMIELFPAKLLGGTFGGTGST